MATASITPPKIIPTKGTISCAVGGRRRISSIKTNIPISAETAATDIFASSGAAGSSRVINSKPKAALWLAPTIDGSTKRLRIKICIIMPATAIDAPVSTIANVRGRRLMNMTCWLSDSENRADHLNSATPTDRLTTNNISSATPLIAFKNEGL